MKTRKLLVILIIMLFSIFISSCDRVEVINTSSSAEESTSSESISESESSSSTTSTTTTSSTIDLSNILFESKSYTYTGEAFYLSVENLPDNYRVTYLNNGKSEVGAYEVTAYLFSETKLELTLTATLTILSNTEISFSSITYTYDGTIYYPEISGELPNGVEVSYDYSKLSVHPGSYSVVATFINGEAFGLTSLEATVVVNALTINLNDYSFNTTFEYDGNEHKITLNDTLPLNLTVEYTNNSLTEVGSKNVVVRFKAKTGYEDCFKGLGTLTLTLTVTAEAEEVSVTSITCDTSNISLTQDINQIDLSGLVVYLNYSDSTKEKTLDYTIKYFSNETLLEEINEVGIYLITVEYNQNSELKTSFEIEVYDSLADIEFESITYTYDGTIHYPEIREELADGILLTYDYIELSVHPGTYKAYAIFTYGNGSSVTLESRVTVNALQINLSDYTFETTYEYDGNEHKVVINEELPLNLTVEYTNNSLTEVGSQTVTATFKAISGYEDCFKGLGSITLTLSVTSEKESVSVAYINCDTSNLNKIQYLTELDLSNLVVYINYTDGSKVETLDYSLDEDYISSIVEEGIYTIIVTYTKDITLTASFEITILEKEDVESFEIDITNVDKTTSLLKLESELAKVLAYVVVNGETRVTNNLSIKYLNLETNEYLTKISEGGYYRVILTELLSGEHSASFDMYISSDATDNISQISSSFDTSKTYITSSSEFDMTNLDVYLVDTNNVNSTTDDYLVIIFKDNYIVDTFSEEGLYDVEIVVANTTKSISYKYAYYTDSSLVNKSLIVMYDENSNATISIDNSDIDYSNITIVNVADSSEVYYMYNETSYKINSSDSTYRVSGIYVANGIAYKVIEFSLTIDSTLINEVSSIDIDQTVITVGSDVLMIDVTGFINITPENYTLKEFLVLDEEGNDITTISSSEIVVNGDLNVIYIENLSASTKYEVRPYYEEVSVSSISKALNGLSYTKYGFYVVGYFYLTGSPNVKTYKVDGIFNGTLIYRYYVKPDTVISDDTFRGVVLPDIYYNYILVGINGNGKYDQVLTINSDLELELVYANLHASSGPYNVYFLDRYKELVDVDYGITSGSSASSSVTFDDYTVNNTVYTFTTWSEIITNVTSNMIVYAIFEPKEVTEYYYTASISTYANYMGLKFSSTNYKYTKDLTYTVKDSTDTTLYYSEVNNYKVFTAVAGETYTIEYSYKVALTYTDVINNVYYDRSFSFTYQFVNTTTSSEDLSISYLGFNKVILTSSNSKLNLSAGLTSDGSPWKNRDFSYSSGRYTATYLSSNSMYSVYESKSSSEVIGTTIADEKEVKCSIINFYKTSLTFTTHEFEKSKMFINGAELNRCNAEIILYRDYIFLRMDTSVYEEYGIKFSSVTIQTRYSVYENPNSLIVSMDYLKPNSSGQVYINNKYVTVPDGFVCLVESPDNSETFSALSAYVEAYNKAHPEDDGIFTGNPYFAETYLYLYFENESLMFNFSYANLTFENTYNYPYVYISDIY